MIIVGNINHKVSYLVLQVWVAEGRDEDPGDAGVPVPGRRVQRGVAVLQRTTKQRGAIKQISWVVCRLDVGSFAPFLILLKFGYSGCQHHREGG